MAIPVDWRWRRRPVAPAGRAVRLALIALAAAAVLPAGGCAVLHREQIRKSLAQPLHAGLAARERSGNLPVIHLYGSHEQMGRQYGTVLREPLQGVQRYAKSILPPWTMQWLLDYGRQHEQFVPPEIRTEIRAAVEAAEIDYYFLIAGNILPKAACSTLAAWGQASRDGKLVMGRNADYFGMGLGDMGSMVVVYHGDGSDLPVAAVSFLGLFGAFASINADGVAMGNMLVFNATGPRQDHAGVTIQLAMRLAGHRAHTARQAAEVLAGMTHAIPMNVMVADPNEALVLEISLLNTTVVQGDNSVLARANCFLRNPDRTDPGECERFRILCNAAAEHYGRIDAEMMKQALYAARVQDLNLQAVVFEPADMRMHVAANRMPASKGPYVAFDLRELFARPAE